MRAGAGRENSRPERGDFLFRKAATHGECAGALDNFAKVGRRGVQVV